MKLRHLRFQIGIGACCALIGCTPPKAVVVEDKPAQTVKAPETAGSDQPPGPRNDGLRDMPMLELPQDTELRPTSPTAAGDRPTGSAVIVTPPVKPEPKPKPAEVSDAGDKPKSGE